MTECRGWERSSGGYWDHPVGRSEAGAEGVADEGTRTGSVPEADMRTAAGHSGAGGVAVVVDTAAVVVQVVAAAGSAVVLADAVATVAAAAAVTACTPVAGGRVAEGRAEVVVDDPEFGPAHTEHDAAGFALAAKLAVILVDSVPAPMALSARTARSSEACAAEILLH